MPTQGLVPQACVSGPQAHQAQAGEARGAVPRISHLLKGSGTPSHLAHQHSLRSVSHQWSFLRKGRCVWSVHPVRVQRDQVICPRSHSSDLAEPEAQSSAQLLQAAQSLGPEGHVFCHHPRALGTCPCLNLSRCGLFHLGHLLHASVFPSESSGPPHGVSLSRLAFCATPWAQQLCLQMAG